jgi:two-component system cell cycle response regulator DivK
MSGQVDDFTMEKTVLIVDDNALNAKLFRDLLTSHGYETLHAGDGAAGLALALTHRPGLIIMDLEMPVMCGREAIGRFKQDAVLRSIPVIAVSAFSANGEMEALNNGGCDAYLEKPIRAQPFLDIVRRFLA